MRRGLVRPAFVAVCPIRISPLAGTSPRSPHLARHFRLFIYRDRLTGTCSRLGSPVIRHRHFRGRLRLHRHNSSRTRVLSRSFLATVRCNVPPANNVNVNVSHTMVLLAGSSAVHRMVYFPAVGPLSWGDLSLRKFLTLAGTFFMWV